MPRLSTRAICLGAGCLINRNGTWKRAVVINCSRSIGFDVQLIDTGAYDEVLDDVSLFSIANITKYLNVKVQVNTIHRARERYFSDKLVNKKFTA